MSTSVKLSEKDKEKLEKLQALVTLKAGEKVTQQELLSTLIREALAKDDEIVKKMFKTKIPISDQEYERILALVEDWGIETSWEEIDQILYGVETRCRKVET